MKTVNIFGATGSIGQNTLNVLRYQSLKENFKVVALSSNNNVEMLACNAKEFKAKYAIVANESKYLDLKKAVSGSSVIPLAGYQKINEVASLDVDWTMNAIVGFAGLLPSLECAKNGKTLALANKESLVCGGRLLISKIIKNGGTLLPVDSEHSAIFQCLNNQSTNALDKVILTASGGPFREWTISKMGKATLKQAINHPNWEMGTRISIDSATMFNKALEVIEAKYLFDIPAEDIEVLVHPESIVHSMVSFRDGSVIAQLGVPDMRAAIGYAFNYPYRRPLPVEKLDLTKIKSLSFEKVNNKKFPALDLAFSALNSGDLFGAIMNASKEIALDKFIAGEIGFLEITELVRRVLDTNEIQDLRNKKLENYDDVFVADSVSRKISKNMKLN